MSKRKNTNSAPIVAVFGSSHSHEGDGYFEEGVRCGALLVKEGFGVATGGYDGLMRAVSKGAHEADANATIIGVTVPTAFPKRAGHNEFVKEERRANSLVERIHEILDTTVASIALHGSLGTLTELFVAWNLAAVSQLADKPPKPVIAVGPSWKRIVETAATDIGKDTLSFITLVDTVEEAMTALRMALKKDAAKDQKKKK